MRSVNKTIRSLVMLVLVCAMLTTAAFAAGEGSVWLRTMESDTDGLSVFIAANTTVTDGQVELVYDAENMIYTGTEINGDYVAMYAVNADEPGVVKIAWVAPGAYEAEDSHWLIQVSFDGEGAVTMNGTINAADGSAVEQTELDTAELEKAILEAEGLYENDYTHRSWATLKKALDIAKDVMNDPAADQSQVDAAAETLRNGMASLELKLFTDNAELYKTILRAQGLCERLYTEESWAVLEEALANAKAVKNDRNATQKQVDEATAALKEAICGLELKSCQEPTEPEVTDPEVTEPEETKPSRPGVSGGGFDKIKDWIGGWFGKGEPEETEPVETTVPETTVPETTVPETTEPAPEGNKGGWFDWLLKWFGWGK
jgi:hypothetical protein